MSSDPVQDILGHLDVSTLAQQVGADPAEVQDAAAKVLPALLGGLHANAQDPGGEASLATALGQHQDDLASGTIDTTQVDPVDGQKVAAHIFGAQQDQVVQQLGATGVSSRPRREADAAAGPDRDVLPGQEGHRLRRWRPSPEACSAGCCHRCSAARPRVGGSSSSNPMGGILGDVLGGLLGQGTKA